MPFPMKIQPINFSVSDDLIGAPFPKAPIRGGDLQKPVAKSRLKRLFERQFPNVLRASTADKLSATAAGGEQQCSDAEPSSVCLAKMVQNFMEESAEKHTASAAAVATVKCSCRNRCNCFNGYCIDCDGEFELGDSPTAAAATGDACEILKSLTPCTSVAERNILADTARIVEKFKPLKTEDDCMKFVTEGLSNLGYDASICKSRWDKSPSFPSGEYEYIDVIVEGERLLVDVDFRSEFEIARSTGSYKAVLQSLPAIFVGKDDRLQRMVAVVSEAAKQSLKKKGLHIPPWRKPEYMRAKWLSPYQRLKAAASAVSGDGGKTAPVPITTQSFSGEFELIFGENEPASSGDGGGSGSVESPGALNSIESEEKIRVVVSPWQPPAVVPKVPQKGAKIVTGLASILREKY